MALSRQPSEEPPELTPEEAEALAPLDLIDPARFLADIRLSQEEWAAWRAAGNAGLPPGWVRARDYFRQRGV